MEMRLSLPDVELLRELLDQAVRDLGPEIHHTQSRNYRSQLEQRRERLSGLLERLGTPTPQPVEAGNMDPDR